jgi:hypothetical protein
MFPIPSGRKLSFIEIAKYWSGEITPSVSPKELRDTISKAWWRGELVAENGPSRLNLLRALYLNCADFIAFAIPGMEEPEQWRSLDGGALEFVRPVRVPLPNADPETWTDANCAEAFESIAEAWDEENFRLIAPIVAGIVLTQDEFNQWINEHEYRRPAFWGNAGQRQTGHQRTKPIQYQIGRAVEALSREHAGKFPPDGMPKQERDRLITEWLDGDDDPVKKPSKRTLRDYFSKREN